MESCQIRIVEDTLYLRTPYSQENLTRCRAIPRGKWRPDWKCWEYPFGPATVTHLLGLFGPGIVRADDTGQVEGIAKAISCARRPSEAPDDLPNVPHVKLSAWKHQRAAYAFARDMPGALLHLGMGTGKTMTTIGTMMDRGRLHLILCPKSVVGVWPMEMDKHFDGDALVEASTGKGAAHKARAVAEALRLYALTGRPTVIVCNYESAWRDTLAKLFLSQRWDNLVLDEVHRIKGPTGKASKFCDKLRPRANFRLGLTGTPLPHSPMDAFAQFRALDVSVFGKSFVSFRSRFAVVDSRFGYAQVVGYQNQDEFQSLFDSITFHAGREVLDLPEEQHVQRECQLSPEARRLYKELADELYVQIGDGEITAANVLVKLLRLAQITGGFVTTDTGDVVQVCSAKKDLLADILDDLPPREPVVVFARFRADLDSIRSVCEAQGRSFCELSGRANQLKEFQCGDFDVIGVNIQSGGVGVDLTRACYAIYYSVGYSLGDFQQSQARIHRPGQERPVAFYYLTAKDTIDETICEAMQKKFDVVELILSGRASSATKRLLFARKNSK